MVYDSHSNFGFTVVAIAPSPATTGTTFSIVNANAAALPDPASVGAYNVTIYAANQQPLSSNSEIVRITAKGAADSGGTGFTQFTITRLTEQNAASSMTARSIQVGDWIANSITKKLLVDLETNKVEKSGDSMSGNLTITRSTSNSSALIITGISGASADVVNINDSGTGAGLKVVSTGVGTQNNAGVFRNQGLAVNTALHVQRTLADASLPAANQSVLKIFKDNSNVNDIGNLVGINNDNTNAGTNCLYIEQHGTGPILRTNDGTSVIFDIDHLGNFLTARSGSGIGAGKSLTIQAGGAESGQSNTAGGTLVLRSGISTGSGLSAIQFVFYKTIANGTNDNATTTLQLVQSSSGTIGLGVLSIASGSGNDLKISAQQSSADTDANGGTLIIAGGDARGSGSSKIQFNTVTPGSSSATFNGSTTKMTLDGNGRLGIGISSPTAFLHLVAGQSGVGLSSFKFTAGTLLSTPENGAMEYDNTSFYLTSSTVNQKKIGYADMSNLVPVASFSMNSQKIINLLDPTSTQDATTKAYVDSVAQGLSPKPSAIVATTTTLPTYTYLSGVITMTSTGVVAIDGHNLALNDVILVKNETSTNQPNNGLYIVTTAGAVGVALVLTRHSSMDASTEFSGGFIFVESGTVNAAAGFVCTNTGSVTVGTTNISFTQFSGAGEIIAGTGITKTSNTLSIGQDVATGANVTFGSVTAAGFISSDQVIISAIAGASLAVGRNGTTNPTFQVDNSISSAVTGILIKGNIAASGVALSVQSSGTDENLTIDAKGAGTITIGGTSSGNIIVSRTLNLGTNNLNTVGNIEIDGTAARDITVGANTSGNAGQNLTIVSGNAGSGTDITAGDLILKSGIGTGTGTSKIQLWINQPASSTGSGAGTLVNVLNITLSSGGSIGLAPARAAAASSGDLLKLSSQDGGTNSNKNGGEIRFQGGQSTGTGLPGQVTSWTSPLSPSSSGTQNSAVLRTAVGATKVLTNNSAINLVNCTIASNTVVGGIIRYAVEVFDATNLQMETGEIMFACVNKGGAFSLNTMTQIGSAKQTLGSGTLTMTWAISAANPAVISLNANSSLTPSSGYPRITYTIENFTQQAIVTQ